MMTRRPSLVLPASASRPHTQACEFLLGRGLRASDNIMKFCVHGGELNKSLAASIMGGGNRGNALSAPRYA